MAIAVACETGVIPVLLHSFVSFLADSGIVNLFALLKVQHQSGCFSVVCK
jgi:hypothetical protein